MSGLDRSRYFDPLPALWPILIAGALLLMAFGAVAWLNGANAGRFPVALGLAALGGILFRWFAALISEGRGGLYSDQVEGSIRGGMAWFIGSEVVVFGALIAALFYERFIAVPGLTSGDTHTLLWPAFIGGWPASGPLIEGSFTAMKPWVIPTLNTAVLLSSGVAITLANIALNRGRRGRLIALVLTTILLGMLFLRMQASEYYHAYTALNLTLATGVYGATFFVLTGLHGLHVAIGTVFLIVMLARILRGDFTAVHHSGFQAATWYWHFVGVVWLIVFIVVYCL
jgi:cytochrome c oxidase subunit III